MPVEKQILAEARSFSAGRLKPFLFFFAVSLSLFQLWSVVFSTVDPLLQRAIFLTWVLALAFLGIRPWRSSFREGPTILEILECLLAILGGFYYLLNFARIQWHWPMVDPLTGLDSFFGLVILLLVLDLTRRLSGCGG